MNALDEAGENDACVVTVLTGCGEYYCSGNDLGNFTRIPPEGPQKMANDAQKVLKYVSRSISFSASWFPNHLFIHSCWLPAFSRSTRVSTPPERLATLFTLTELPDSSSPKSNQKKVDWYAWKEVFNFFTSLNHLDLDRFVPSTLPLTLPQTLTLWSKFPTYSRSKLYKSALS